MNDAQRVDVLFHSVLSRFFTIPGRQPASGNVTFARMRVLWILEFQKSAALGSVARTLGVSDSTATELVDKLVRGGYVRRVQSKDDRRQVVLTLRPKAHRVLADFAQRRQERFRSLLRVLDPADVRRMAEALETLSVVLGKWHGGER